MLQRREMMLAEGGLRAQMGAGVIGGERPTADEVRALTSYLSNNVAAFRPPNMSSAMLRRLLLRCSVSSISPEEVQQGRYVYVRGVPAAFCCLLLHGRLQIRAGNEGFTSELGPWTTLAMQALTDVHYVPDFTARVECATRIVIISRKEVHAVLGIAAGASPALDATRRTANEASAAAAIAGAAPTGAAPSELSRRDSSVSPLVPRAAAVRPEAALDPSAQILVPPSGGVVLGVNEAAGVESRVVAGPPMTRAAAESTLMD